MKRGLLAGILAVLVVVGAVIWTRNLDTAHRRPVEGGFVGEGSEQTVGLNGDGTAETGDSDEIGAAESGDPGRNGVAESGDPGRNRTVKTGNPDGENDPASVYIPAEPFKELEQLINEDFGGADGEDGHFGSGTDGEDGHFGNGAENGNERSDGIGTDNNAAAGDKNVPADVDKEDPADVDKDAPAPDEILNGIKTEEEPALEENTATVSRIWYDEVDLYETRNGIVSMVYRFPTGGQAFMRGKMVTFDEAVELPRFTGALRELFPDSFDDVYDEFVRIRHWEDLWKRQNAADMTGAAGKAKTVDSLKEAEDAQEVPWTGYIWGRYFGKRYVQMSVSSQQVAVHVYPADYEDEYLPKPGEVTEFYNYRPE